jgi:hypothetical protein
VPRLVQSTSSDTSCGKLTATDARGRQQVDRLGLHEVDQAEHLCGMSLAAIVMRIPPPAATRYLVLVSANVFFM